MKLKLVTLSTVVMLAISGAACGDDDDVVGGSGGSAGTAGMAGTGGTGGVGGDTDAGNMDAGETDSGADNDAG